MTDRLTHRGPDGRGVHRIEYSDGSGIALGHRRLSIIDLDGGTQPMCNEDGTVWITFNGEIYNYRELRPALEAAGHQFKTHSDTETIVHLYEEYGDQFVEHLRGMFAIAIWDERRKRLVLVRDRLGQKPLVYHQTENRLIFASEMKAIIADRDVPRTIRPAAIDEYLLYGYIPHPNTIFEGIHKLAPAHMAVYENGRLQIRRYWNPDMVPDENPTQSELSDRLRQVVSDAVRLRMRSDVPLGAFLSGGIDSTIIVGAMQQHAVSPTKTYAIGFPADGFDESSFAATAAEHLGTDHHNMVIKPDSLGLIEKLVDLFDEPFADSSAVPTYYVSQMTREHVKVALTGDGGDELFCGYDRYSTIEQLGKFDRLPSVLRKMLTGPWIDWLPGGSQSSIRRRLKHRLQVLRQPLEKRYENWMTGFPMDYRSQLYNGDFRKMINFDESSRFLEGILNQNRGLQPGIRAMRADLISYLPCDLLAKVDITSMAHGLECRSPFLDHHVVEAAFKFPFDLLSRSGYVKPALTSTFKDMIPESLRSRPKMGFSVPLDSWFRNELREFTSDSLLSSDSFCQSYFSEDSIRSLLREHQNGVWKNGHRIWSLLFLETWGRKFSQSN